MPINPIPEARTRSRNGLSADIVTAAVAEAADTFRFQPEVYAAMQRNAMRKRLGWDQAAMGYEALYRLARSRLI